MSNSTEINPALENLIVFGFGAQGSAQALNLRDSGRRVGVFARPESKRIKDINEHGLKLYTDPAEAARTANIAAIMLPDKEQAKFYEKYLEPNLPQNSAIVFAHGLAVHYGLIKPRADLDILLVAPLGHAEAVRNDYLTGTGVPCMLAVDRDASGFATARAHEYAKAISKTGPFINTTFIEEVETDLFAEQALLCGGLPELVKATFDTMVGAGYNADAAYFSCLKELRPIVSLMDRLGVDGMRERISDTARFGAITRGPRVIDSRTKTELLKILSEIKSGEFMREFIEKKPGNQQQSPGGIEETEHPIEKIHRRYNPNLR